MKNISMDHMDLLVQTAYYIYLCMSVFAMFVTSSITARSHHITHVTLCSSHTVSGVSRPTEAVWRRQSTAAAARLSHKMGKPGSSPTNRQYRHAGRQCMDWPLWTLCWPYGVRCPVITWSSVLPCHIFTNIEVLTLSFTASVSISSAFHKTQYHFTLRRKQIFI